MKISRFMTFNVQKPVISLEELRKVLEVHRCSDRGILWLWEDGLVLDVQIEQRCVGRRWKNEARKDPEIRPIGSRRKRLEMTSGVGGNTTRASFLTALVRFQSMKRLVAMLTPGAKVPLIVLAEALKSKTKDGCDGMSWEWNILVVDDLEMPVNLDVKIIRDTHQREMSLQVSPNILDGRRLLTGETDEGLVGGIDNQSVLLEVNFRMMDDGILIGADIDGKELFRLIRSSHRCRDRV